MSRLLRSVLDSGRASLLEHEADLVARSYGLRVAPSGLARTEGELAPLARKLGFPLVLKIASKDVLHKSDVGGVVAGVTSLKDARSAYREILRNVRAAKPRAAVSGVLVQKMAPRGNEFVVGGSRDPQFGPAVMFGLGGVYVELFRDVSFRLAPLSKDEAFEMMKQTKSSKLMEGFRGSKPLDARAAAKAIVAVGDIMADHPDIDSVDVNPLFVYPHGVLAVDVRVMVKERATQRTDVIRTREARRGWGRRGQLMHPPLRRPSS
ncbi:MAG: acetate--CoA ligase family protein [Nitrososphaerota archaeon]|nr:acetate--CoA ligase family protein [Nitrososphaerota archaeon]